MKKITSTVLMVVLLVSMVTSLPGAISVAAESGDIAFYVGSPLCLRNGVVSPIDSANPSVVATLQNSSTFVPLRFVAEHFGGTVGYAADSKTATIVFGGKKASFPMGKDYFTLSGKKVSLYANSFLDTTGRAMVPLRAIAETVLGQKVGYVNGAILIGDGADGLTAGSKLYQSIKQKIGKAVVAGSFEQIKAQLIASGVLTDGGTRSTDIYNSANKSTAAESAPSAANTGVATDSAAGSGEYSSTNVQVQGVDEGDVIKTDGKYLYLVNNNSSVSIIRADGEKMEVVSKLQLPLEKYVSELYIDGDKLVVIGNKYEKYDGGITPMPAVDAKIAIMPGYYRTPSVFAEVYNIVDRKNPALLKSIAVEGNLLSTRKTGGILYFTATKYISYMAKSDAAPGTILPTVSKNGGTATPISVRNVIILPDTKPQKFTTIAAVDLSDKQADRVQSFLTGGDSTMYMTDSSIYLSGPDYFSGSSMTSISKFLVDGTTISYAAGGSVPGYAVNQFAMDEYDGHFRIAVTNWNESTSTNAVYVLDETLNVCGSVTNLAPGERIYSVRFMGKKGYIVTYRSIDPLFTFDLTDPKNPKLTGELKVPGFSNYLHPISDTLLLGIGQDTQEVFAKDNSGNVIPIGTRTAGIKVSLFDVSNPAKPVEKSTMTYGGSGSYTEAQYNHKALLFKPSEGLVGFGVNLTEDGLGSKQFSGGMLFKVGENGISEAGRVEADNPSASYSYSFGFDRLSYIGNTLYYAKYGTVTAYSLNNFAKLSQININ